MSVCCECIKTTADSNDNNNKTLFLDISDLYIEYNIFDISQSEVNSNTFHKSNQLNDELISKLNLVNLE